MEGPATDLDALDTEELRHRAFTLAEKHHDFAFFWSVFKHLPHAEDEAELDSSLGNLGSEVSDLVALWREFIGRGGYGDAEPLLRAKFIDYLVKHG
jgi:hypothetical protein